MEQNEYNKLAEEWEDDPGIPNNDLEPNETGSTKVVFKSSVQSCIKEEEVTDEEVVISEEDATDTFCGFGLEKSNRTFYISLHKNGILNSKSNDLAVQILEILVPPKATNCGDCQTIFATRDALLSHLKTTHLTSKQNSVVTNYNNAQKSEVRRHAENVFTSSSWDFVNDSEKLLILDDNVELVPDPENPHEFTTRQPLTIVLHGNIRKGSVTTPQITPNNDKSKTSVDNAVYTSNIAPNRNGHIIDIVKPRGTETPSERTKQISLLRTPETINRKVLEIKKKSGAADRERPKIDETPIWTYGSGWNEKQPRHIIKTVGWELKKRPVPSSPCWSNSAVSVGSKKLKVKPRTIKVHMNSEGSQVTAKEHLKVTSIKLLK